MQDVLDGTNLFPSDMLPDMVHGFLSDPESTDLWLTCEVDNKAIGLCYAAPEMLANGSWNMLAIAVHPHGQGKGAGSAMAAKLEAALREKGHRILIADTSGTDAYRQTREFYLKNGYAQESVIRDFWADGDDKITFWKSLK